MEKANTTVVQQIIEKAEQCEKKNQQCWFSNETFNNFVKEVDKPSLSKEGYLMFEGKGEGCNLKFAISLERCHTSSAFAKLIRISEVNWYTGAERKSIYKIPESTQNIRIL